MNEFFLDIVAYCALRQRTPRTCRKGCHSSSQLTVKHQFHSKFEYSYISFTHSFIQLYLNTWSNEKLNLKKMLHK